MNQTIQTVTLANDEIVSNNQQCFFVYLFSFAFLLGFIKLFTIFRRIVSIKSWFKNDIYKKYGGGWAVVTGASQGIGFGYAQELAKRGFNIVMLSRSIDKLQNAKKQILKNHKVQIKVHSCDFQKLRTPVQYVELFSNFSNLDISILVNNVGYYNPRPFLQNSYDDIKKQMVINCLPISCLTNLVIPLILKRKQFGAIINISSGAAQNMIKGTSHYCATKAFDDFFTRTVAYEYPKIDFLSVRPYLVTTTLARNTKSILHSTPQKCAQGSLRDLGNYKISYGNWFHRIQGVVLEQLDCWVINWMLGEFNKGVIKKYKQIDQKSK